MTIEVKQMIIKSTVVSGSAEQQYTHDPAVDIEQLKEMVADVCRELIVESRNESQER